MAPQPCEAAREEFDAGDHDPGDGALDRGFEVLGETSISVEPGEGVLDAPSARQQDEALGVVGASADLDGELR